MELRYNAFSGVRREEALRFICPVVGFSALCPERTKVFVVVRNEFHIQGFYYFSYDNLLENLEFVDELLVTFQNRGERTAANCR